MILINRSGTDLRPSEPISPGSSIEAVYLSFRSRHELQSTAARKSQVPRRGRSSSLLRAVLLKKSPSEVMSTPLVRSSTLGLVLASRGRVCAAWRAAGSSPSLLCFHLPASHRDGDLADKSGTSTFFVVLWPRWLVLMLLFARTSPRCMCARLV